MATIEDLKADLESYVKSVTVVELENARLKEKVAFLEHDREYESKMWFEKLNVAKESWRDQALQHGRNQKQRTILECEKVMQAFQSELRAQQSTYQTRDSSLLLSCLLRAESSIEVAEHERRVYEAMAFTQALMTTVTLQDYDIEDNHVLLFNRTDSEIGLIGCCLRFSCSGARYRFPDDTMMMPHSTLSLWYGNDAHNSIRNARNAGSLYWRSDSAITTNFSSRVDLIDKKGSLFATVPANKERYPGAERHDNERHVHLSGTSALPGPHDHFLRFDHFLRLKNDAFNQLQVGCPEQVPNERESNPTPCSSSGISQSPAKSTSSSLSILTPSRKRSRKSTTTSSPEATAPVSRLASNLTTKEADNIEFPPAPVLGLLPVSDTSKETATTKLTASHLQNDVTSLSVWNVQALTLSLRPYLLSRNQGCLFLQRVIRKDEGRNAVAVSISNTGDQTIDLSGWRLFAMGNPSQELFLPANAHVNGGSHVTLVSDMEEDTLLWSQVASSCGLSLDAFTAPSITSQNDIPEVSPDIEENGNAHSSSSARSVSTAHQRRSRRSLARESSCDIFADVPVHIGVSEDRHGQVETEGAQIVVVAGLKSLSKGDVLSLHLIDRMGRNICMLRGDSNSERVKGNAFRGQRTVFGDKFEEAALKGKAPFVPSLPYIGGIPKISSPNCTVM